MTDGTVAFGTASKLLASNENAGNDYVLGTIGKTMFGGSGTDFLELDLSSFTTAISLRLKNQVFSAVQLASNTSIQGFETFQLTTGSGADTLDLRDFTLESFVFDEWYTADSSFDLSTGKDTVFVSSTTKGYAFVSGAEVLHVDFSLVDQDVVVYQGGARIDEGGLDIQFPAGQLRTIIATGGSGDDSLWGVAGADKLNGGAGDDDFRGEAGADTLTGGTGDDVIDGGEGKDVAIYSGVRANFLVTQTRDGTAYVRDLRSGKDNLGADTLINIENLKFDDGQFELKEVLTNLPPYDLEFGSPQVSERQTVGSVVQWIHAFDPEGDKITYSLSSNPGGKFEIVGNELRLKAPVDYETAKSHTITIVATDAVGNSISGTFKISVFDIDETPVISSNLGGWAASISIDETRRAVTKVIAADPEGKAITYSIFGADSKLFNIDAKTGVLSFKTAPDYETPKDVGKNNVYEVAVQASDGENSDIQVLKVTVEDVNEAPHNVALEGRTVKENVKVGAVAGIFSAVDPEGGKLTYKLTDSVNGLFKLVGRELVVAKAIDYEKVQWDKITVQVTDADGLSTTKTFTIAVKDLAEVLKAPSSGGVTTGGIGADILEGGIGNDTLRGLVGDDILKGAAGNDKLYGGLGADDLYGGSGKDVFLLKELSDSTVASSGRDTIFDFSVKDGDKIDLSGIDANTKTTIDDAFLFVGTKMFSGKAAELRYVQNSSGTYIYGDVDGNGNADFMIHLDDKVALQNEYFIL
jgi:Ca2+-binding RTX toxin-like protein